MAFRVGVLIATHNSVAVLPVALDSILRQTRQPDEVLVADDGSTDDTCQLVREWAQRNGIRLNLVSLPAGVQRRFRGPALPRQTGLQNTTVELIAYLDHDDSLEPAHLERLEAAFRAHPDLVLCFGDARVEYSDGRIRPSFLLGTSLERVPFEESGSLRLLKGSVYGSLLQGSYIPTCSVMFSRAAALRVGGADGTLGTTDDVDLFMRLVKTGPVAYYADVLGVRREHGDNLSSARNAFDLAYLWHKVLLKRLEQAVALGLSPEEIEATEHEAHKLAPDILYHASRKNLPTYFRAAIELAQNGSLAASMNPIHLARALVFSTGRRG